MYMYNLYRALRNLQLQGRKHQSFKDTITDTGIGWKCFQDFQKVDGDQTTISRGMCLRVYFSFMHVV